MTLTCSHEGGIISNSSGSLKPQPTVKMGCRARISGSSDTFGNWRINAVNLDHNHETSPSKSRLYRCNRHLSVHVKRQLQVNDLARIPLNKSYNSVVVEADGYENMTCIEKDCRNYIEQLRCLRLGEGDAAAIQTYFSKMQARSPEFYFSMDLDDKSRLRNDMASMHALSCSTRWCLWYILKKLPEKFGYHVDKGSIFGAIHGLVYDSQSTGEFEDGWRTMIDTYELHDNDWLSGLYENRGRWVPCFFKTTFWAGMSNTQRSECMNAFFDSYVHSKTLLK
ncbi:protein FAR1-RELATED SEQUENCE 6-like [Olea europaea var. sylvestris]|uniref:protein FAR1-RELATED SEQUENCE 6-like n=1 Tax=Olea europaea var. sylvestris TaxID=158386 RepID=UPI000C1D665A|nr:protein FAR1-RELATED SEQUENCE 6-like [Olea europaea var. sylvestris]